MKKSLYIFLCAAVLLSSCGTYAGAGAATGASFGSIIGSAIGGISGGWRGRDIGTLIGMAGGAAVGAAVGTAAEQAEQKRYAEYRSQRENRQQAQVAYEQGYNEGYDDARADNSNARVNDNSGFDATNSGDDRLIGFDENLKSKVEPSHPVAQERLRLEVRNAELVDLDRDGKLRRGETARMTFEIYNCSGKTAYAVQPFVNELTGNKHIRVSENVLIESIPPGKAVRYTGFIKADDRLKDGEAWIQIGVFHSNREVSGQTQKFKLPTSKR